MVIEPLLCKLNCKKCPCRPGWKEIGRFVACKAGGMLPAAEFDGSCSEPQTLGPCTWIPFFLQARKPPRVIRQLQAIT